MKAPYFSLAQRKVPKETRLFARQVLKMLSTVVVQEYVHPSTSLSPFRLWRNDAHPLAEAVETQPPLATKRPKRRQSFRGLRKISDPENDGAFLSDPAVRDREGIAV